MDPHRCCSVTFADRYLCGSAEPEALTETLKTLWGNCFPDDDETIDFFFESLYKPETTVLAIMDDTIVGACYLVKSQVIQGKAETEAAQVKETYCGHHICVRPGYRTLGICREMQNFVFEYILKSNFAYIVSPPNDRLIDYFRSLGMTDAFSCGTYIYSAVQKTGEGENNDGDRSDEDEIDESFLVCDVEIFDYRVIRDRFFSGSSSYVKFDEETLEFFIRENDLSGGFCKKVIFNGEADIILAKIENGVMTVRETTIPDNVIDTVSEKLASYFDVENIVYNVASDLYPTHTVRPDPEGVAKGISSSGGYIGLIK